MHQNFFENNNSQLDSIGQNTMGRPLEMLGDKFIKSPESDAPPGLVQDIRNVEHAQVL